MAENHLASFADFEDNLYRAAQEEAAKAVRAYASEDSTTRREAALAIGASIEYLIASAVIALDPVLLADPSQPSSQYMLSRNNDPSSIDLIKLRTSTWGAQLKILKFKYPSIPSTDDLQMLMSIRNSAAHVALAPHPMPPAVMPLLVRSLDALHSALPHRPAGVFWSQDVVNVVAAMRQAGQTALHQRVLAKVAYFAQQLNLLLAGFDSEGRTRALAMLERRPVPSPIKGPTQERECPACKQTGEMTYVAYRDDDPTIETEYDQNNVPAHEWAIFEVTGSPTFFSCPVCALTLDEDELSVIPDLSEEVKLPDESEDADDYYFGLVDEDIWRGR